MDATFLIIILVLLTFGLIMLFSASYAYAYYQYGDSLYFIKRQAIFAVMGIAGMLFVSCVNYHVLLKFVPWFFGGGLLLLVIVLT